MAEASPAAADAPRPGAGWALGLALAAAFSSWNPFAAPLGLVVGLGAALLAFARLRRGQGRRSLLMAALALGLCASAASVAVLFLTAGAVTTELPGAPVVQGRTDAEAQALLDEAARRTAAARDRAKAELRKAGGAAPLSKGTRGSTSDGERLQPVDAGAVSADEDETE